MADSVKNLSDAELIELGQNVSTALTSIAPASYGSTTTKATVLEALFTTFKDDVAAQSAKQAEAQSLTATKNGSRTAYIAGLREFLNVAKASGTAESNMQLLGVPKNGGAPAPTFPLAKVDTSQRMTHKISWGDAADTGHQRRPKGVMGAEIWVKIGDPPPGNEKDCTFLAVDAASPYVAVYQPEDTGKIAHYMLRWRMQDGSLGPWAETVSATITG